MIIFGIIIVVLLIIGLSLYNSLIAKKNQVDNAFSAIDAMLKKRYDLLPNLVETVKQYMQHEAGLLSKIVELRSKASNPDISSEERLQIDAQMSTALKSVMVTVENYPDLKASQNFIQLQSTWTESEEQIAAARRTYNASVTDYNNGIMMFPGSIIAGMMNYKPMAVLSIPEEERKNISAKDLFNR
ncbi:putative lemA protein [Pedobacter sp. BAL39]|uniref:LemA family protein n=1 Tax=Pedobacter sp. BAL39 TaxID=391596 RepID=UPI00015597EE|nr:LemA family protein [Pedobacter sp. BAL39]EDM37581.1 putative lemA protein [Pedobacter sp. BAL39]